jgi:DNA-binding response OmpR family regulator
LKLADQIWENWQVRPDRETNSHITMNDWNQVNQTVQSEPEISSAGANQLILEFENKTGKPSDAKLIECYKQERPLELRGQPLKLLEILWLYKGNLVSYEDIFRVCITKELPDENYRENKKKNDNAIYKLKERLDTALGSSVYIVTQKGSGYKLNMALFSEKKVIN